MNLPHYTEEGPWLYPQDEGELVQAAQRNPQEFLALSRPLFVPLYRYLFTRLGSASEAEEAAIQIFVAAQAQLTRGRPGRNYPARLLSIAVHQSPHVIPGGAFPFSTGHEELDQLAVLLRQVEEGDRELLRMQYALGLPAKAIASLRHSTEKAEQHSLDQVGLDLERRLLGYEPQEATGPSQLTQQRILALFAAITPPEGYAERLEYAVLDQISSRPQTARRQMDGVIAWMRRHTWSVALGIGAAVLAVVLLGNPQQMLRTGQNLLARLPGVNYINLDGTRVLASPVSVTRSGVKLVVTQVLAYSEGTDVSFTSLGLPGRRPDMNVQLGQFALVLKDGQRLTPSRMELHFGEARLTFPPIPPAESELSLRVERLPLARLGSAPEGWDVPLALRKANGDNPAERPPEEYTPDGAAATTQGLTLEVVQVSQSAEETAVEVQVKSTDPNWKIDATRIEPSLADADGHNYNQQAGESAGVVVEQSPSGPFGGPVETPDPGAVRLVYRYAPLAGVGDEAALQVPSIPVRVPMATGFLFKPVEAMQVGQEWVMDDVIDVQGVPLRLLSARLEEGPKLQLRTRDNDRQYYLLTFEAELEQPAGRRIESISYSASPGRATGPVWTGSNQLTFAIVLPYLPVAGQPVEIRIDEAQVVFDGPWEVRWNLPSAAPQPAAQRWTPGDTASTSVDGVSLSVQAVEQGANFTLLNLGLDGLPPGDPIQVMSLASGLEEAALEDSWGVPHSLSWSTDAGDGGPFQLSFPPLPLSEDHFTLVVPSLRLLVPAAPANGARDSLIVYVPADKPLNEKEVTRTVFYAGNSRQIRSQYFLSSSELWKVYQQVNIGGYRIRFSYAQIEHDPFEGEKYALLLFGQVLDDSEPGAITGLKISQVEVPGVTSISASASGESPLARLELDGYNVRLRLDVSDQSNGRLLPGLYGVRFSAAEVTIPGPWRIRVATPHTVLPPNGGQDLPGKSDGA